MWLIRCVTTRNLEAPQKVVSSAGSTVCVWLYLAVNAVIGEFKNALLLNGSNDRVVCGHSGGVAGWTNDRAQRTGGA